MYAQVQMINNANTKTPSKEYTEKKEKNKWNKEWNNGKETGN